MAQLQAQYQQVMPQQAAAPPQTNQGLLWVQGEAGAKSYLVAPNTTVLLMDSESQRFYLKSTDGAGVVIIMCVDITAVTDIPVMEQWTGTAEIMTGTWTAKHLTGPANPQSANSV